MDVDQSRDFRQALALGYGVLYMMVLFYTGFSIYAMTTGPFTWRPSDTRWLIFLIAADAILTAGAVCAVKSVRAKDRRRSWRLLGWVGLAFVAGMGTRAFEAATASSY